MRVIDFGIDFLGARFVLATIFWGSMFKLTWGAQ
jgi:hypothetical protein